MSLAQAVANGHFEVFEVGIVDGIQALLFDELPQPLNEIEVRRIRWQVESFDLQGLGQGLY